MKFFSRSPISRFDLGIAIVVLVLAIVMVYAYQLWRPSQWEKVCLPQKSGELDSMSEQKISALCKAHSNRETTLNSAYNDDPVKRERALEEHN